MRSDIAERLAIRMFVERAFADLGLNYLRTSLLKKLMLKHGRSGELFLCMIVDSIDELSLVDGKITLAK